MIIEAARQQWVKDVEEKQREHDEWLAVNGAAIEEWNAKKKEYNDNKQKLEYELKRLPPVLYYVQKTRIQKRNKRNEQK